MQMLGITLRKQLANNMLGDNAVLYIKENCGKLSNNQIITVLAKKRNFDCWKTCLRWTDIQGFWRNLK